MTDAGKLNRVISLLGTSDVKNMELLGTISYLAKMIRNKEQTLHLMKEIKPQFSSDEISRKIEELQRKEILVFPQ